LAVERWLRHYQSERVPDEGFNAFVSRIGTASFEALVAELQDFDRLAKRTADGARETFVT